MDSFRVILAVVVAFTASCAPGAEERGVGAPAGEASTGDETPKDEPTVWNPAGSCGEVLAMDERDARAVVQSVDLCKQPSGAHDWGVVSARWVMADGSPAPDDPAFHLGHGILSAFGQNTRPRAGATMLALSSGTAR